MLKYMVMVVLLTSLVGCGGIETGNVGVRTSSFTQTVDMQEVDQGFYTSIISNVKSFSTKEVSIPIRDLQPKASDNLSLSDLDVDIYYRVESTQIAEIYVQYSGKSQYDPDNSVWYPAYGLVKSLSRSAIYSASSEFESLELHKNRDKLSSRIKTLLSDKLNERSPGVFEITSIVIRNAQTDPSIEDAIKLAVTKDKEYEAAKKQVEVNQQLAIANLALQKSLSPEIIKMRELDVMEKAITTGSKPFVMFGSAVTPLINVSAKE